MLLLCFNSEGQAAQLVLQLDHGTVPSAPTPIREMLSNVGCVKHGRALQLGKYGFDHMVVLDGVNSNHIYIQRFLCPCVQLRPFLKWPRISVTCVNVLVNDNCVLHICDIR